VFILQTSSWVQKIRKKRKRLEGAQSRHFELFWPHTKFPLNGRKPENNSLIRWINTKEIMINHMD